MKATLVYSDKVTVTVKGQRRISVVMDLYKLPSAQSGYPEGYKFSWIAFDPQNPSQRVLFDVHPPKGPHLHIDGDLEGTPYSWTGLKDAEEFFLAKIQERFGEITEEEE
jgi:hypothetical protein